ncbi:cysteine proteinase [Nemania sp. FL0916]|nr:cysteine proteinase [Nemania sp. FL0916]
MMSGHHLPAGQTMPGGVGGVGGPAGAGAGIVNGTGTGAGTGAGVNGGGRRRAAPPYPGVMQYQQQHQQAGVIHPSTYMNPYANAYYPSQHMAHHYQTGHVPGSHPPHYSRPSYNAYSQRPPQTILHQTYPPIVSSSMQAHPVPYARPVPQPPQQQQPSPALSTPPPFPAPVPPTPASASASASASAAASSPLPTPEIAPAPVPVSQAPAPASPPSSSPGIAVPITSTTPQLGETVTPHPEADPPLLRTQVYPLPWLSVPDEPFPRRVPKSRRRRRRLSVAPPVELPTSNQAAATHDQDTEVPSSSKVSTAPNLSQEDSAKPVTPAVGEPTKAPTPNSPQKWTNRSLETPTENLSHGDDADIVAVTSRVSETTIQSSSEEGHAHSALSSPTSANAAPLAASNPTTQNKPARRTAVPAVPVIPAVPKRSSKETTSVPPPNDAVPAAPSSSRHSSISSQPPTEAAQADSAAEVAPSQPKKAPPKLWSNLFQQPASNLAPSNEAKSTQSAAAAAGALSSDAASGNDISGHGSFGKSNANTLAEALRDFKVSKGQTIAFLEPRGLVNTGNMCYMNSVLQALVFCTPFYDFLDQVSKKVAHSFKSETPLIDAMVMFLREYRVIDSADSADQLQRRLKSEQLEQYGDSFIPEFVYDAMKRLPRFATMERGHQQDAEEFLGFLLQALSDECAHVMRRLDDTSSTNDSPSTSVSASSPTSTTAKSEWLEVGRKQKAAVTRSSGHSTIPSPINKIFSGQQRSVVRVQGQKDSVTCEPYQPLQLDIGDAHVTNIVDALKHYTRSETLNEDFGSVRHDIKLPTKQVLIESVPPVLILHLKRFKFDPQANGTIKLWTKIDFPLELELPKEILSPLKRSALQAEGIDSLKYRLTAAVYHHGKSASGGHYTVDIRRQDGREWIRVDDTVIRRIRSEDVAKVSLDANPSKSGTKVDHKISAGPATGNRFDGIGDEEGADDEGWNRVTSSGNSAKKWSSVVNSTSPNSSTPTKNTSTKDNIKDNKVAYLLFYEKI